METQEFGKQRKITTIQVDENTLLLLKRLKQELKASSYNEVITKRISRNKVKSFAGSLAKYYKDKPLKKILEELQDERRKSDRF